MVANGYMRRDEKLFVDRDDLSVEEARKRLQSKRIILSVGPDVAASPTLQAALLTAANTASRWCGSVELKLPMSFSDELRLPWPEQSLTDALRRHVPSLEPAVDFDEHCSVLAFGGGAAGEPEALQVTFDGWSGAVAAGGPDGRMPEHERCVLAGVTAGGLAVSEVFMEMARISVLATRRRIGLSLWRPDLPFDARKAFGPPVQYLPDAVWVLGLGHLGQAYLWSLSMLPYRRPDQVRLMLQDFDLVDDEANLGTQLLTTRASFGQRKTRVAEEFLRSCGFSPARIDRRFDANTKRESDEPGLALCGFDGQGPRHLLDQAGFTYVIECGLGGRHDDFDRMQLHTLPNPKRPASEIWPQGEADQHARGEDLAERRQAYQNVLAEEKCGHVELASKSVAVPFVGAVASSLVIGEALRILHAGDRCVSLGVSLSSPSEVTVHRTAGGYNGRDMPRLSYLEATAAPKHLDVTLLPHAEVRRAYAQPLPRLAGRPRSNHAQTVTDGRCGRG